MFFYCIPQNWLKNALNCLHENRMCDILSQTKRSIIVESEQLIDEIIDSLKQDNVKSFEYLKQEYKAIRAGRANPHILDKVFVNYYGTITPINQMANISVPEPRMLAISVWDHSQVKEVSKAIMAAELGLNPSDDGRIVRVVFPILTEERRRDLVKQVKKLCEDCKITVRNARRDCLDMCKQLKRDGEISEDDYTSIEKEVQKIVDSANAYADELSEEKEKEIMSV